MFTNRDLRKLLIPLVLEQMLSGLMGIADTMMVTSVGDTAISAVSCVDSINTLMLYLLSALATGGTIVSTIRHNFLSFLFFAFRHGLTYL